MKIVIVSLARRRRNILFSVVQLPEYMIRWQHLTWPFICTPPSPDHYRRARYHPAHTPAHSAFWCLPTALFSPDWVGTLDALVRTIVLTLRQYTLILSIHTSSPRP